MLDAFIGQHRDVIIEQARARVRQRMCPTPSEVELQHGIPMFLDQLRGALARASAGADADHGDIDRSAVIHGSDLQRMGLTIGQVVHDYGDVCQVITSLALQENAPIPVDDFQTLNLCLDDAIAAAVTEFARQREVAMSEAGTEKLGILAHELRNLLNTALLSFDSIRKGQVTPSGSTAVVHGRALEGLRGLIDRSMADVRLDAGIERQDRLRVGDLVEEIEIAAIIQSQAKSIRLAVRCDEPDLTIVGDRQILVAAVANLLQNAFKFTPKHGDVSLHVHAKDAQVLLDVEDACGGLPPGKAEELFLPFAQRGKDRTGVGLGLAICLKAAHANGGELRVRDLPGKGCVFTLELPQSPEAGSAAPPGGAPLPAG